MRECSVRSTASIVIIVEQVATTSEDDHPVGAREVRCELSMLAPFHHRSGAYACFYLAPLGRGVPPANPPPPALLAAFLSFFTPALWYPSIAIYALSESFLHRGRHMLRSRLSVWRRQHYVCWEHAQLVHRRRWRNAMYAVYYLALLVLIKLVRVGMTYQRLRQICNSECECLFIFIDHEVA